MGHIWLLCYSNTTRTPLICASRSFEKIEAEILRACPADTDFDGLNQDNPE